MMEQNDFEAAKVEYLQSKEQAEAMAGDGDARALRAVLTSLVTVYGSGRDLSTFPAQPT
jgi:hypothetical protein